MLNSSEIFPRSANPLLKSFWRFISTKWEIKRHSSSVVESEWSFDHIVFCNLWQISSYKTDCNSLCLKNYFSYAVNDELLSNLWCTIVFLHLLWSEARLLTTDLCQYGQLPEFQEATWIDFHCNFMTLLNLVVMTCCNILNEMNESFDAADNQIIVLLLQMHLNL